MCGHRFKDIDDWYNHQKDHESGKIKQKYKNVYKRRYRENTNGNRSSQRGRSQKSKFSNRTSHSD